MLLLYYSIKKDLQTGIAGIDRRVDRSINMYKFDRCTDSKIILLPIFRVNNENKQINEKIEKKISSLNSIAPQWLTNFVEKRGEDAEIQSHLEHQKCMLEIQSFKIELNSN